jgi:PAS domain-containing protein
LEDCRSDYKVEFRLARRTARTAGYWQLLYCGVPRTDGNAVPGCHLAVTEARCEEEEHTELLTREQAARHDAAAVRQQLDVILENVSDGLVALDKDWRYTYVNRHAAELFGRRPEDLIGRHIWTEFPEGIGQPFHLAYEKRWPSGSSFRWKTTMNGIGGLKAASTHLQPGFHLLSRDYRA